MSPEAQRIAIAEARGWTGIYTESARWPIVGSTNEFLVGTPPPDRDGFSVDVPDYLNDLNAMHEAEKVLDAEQQGKYILCLVTICGPAVAWKATAAQRAEAFLRTIGKWQD